MRLYCTRCEQPFEAEEPRCPRCLRKSTVREAGDPAATPPRAEPLLAGDPAAGGGGWGAWLLRFVLGAGLFAALTASGSVALPGREPWMIAFAAVLGGALLAVGWSVLARVARDRPRPAPTPEPVLARRRRTVLIAGALLVVALVAGRITWTAVRALQTALSPTPDWVGLREVWFPCRDLIPLDVDGDGDQELIVLLTPRGPSRRATLQAVELPGGEVLWSRRVPAVGSGVNVLDGGDGAVTLLRWGTDDWPADTSLTVYDAADGRQRWRLDAAEVEGWDEMAQVWVRGDAVLLHHHDGPTAGLLALDPRDGHERGRLQDVASLGEAPVRAGSLVAMQARWIDEGLVVADLDDGRSWREPGSWAWPAVPVESGLAALRWGEDGPGELTLISAAGGATPLLRDGRPLTFPGAGALETVTAVYGERVLVSHGYHHHERVDAVSLDDPARDWQCTFDDGFELSTEAIGQWRGEDPERAAPHRWKGRYAPLILIRDREGTIHGESRRRQRKLCVLDLEDGSLPWCSGPFEPDPSDGHRASLEWWDVAPGDDAHAVRLSWIGDDDDEHAALVVLDAATGRFRGAVTLSSDDREVMPISPDIPQGIVSPNLRIDGDVLVLRDTPAAAVDLSTLALVWHGGPGDLQLRSARTEVELLLGPMPWQDGDGGFGGVGGR